MIKKYAALKEQESCHEQDALFDSAIYKAILNKKNEF
jgi:hypothetical protein